jgi:Tfp pilus assembly protein PilF
MERFRSRSQEIFDKILLNQLQQQSEPEPDPSDNSEDNSQFSASELTAQARDLLDRPGGEGMNRYIKARTKLLDAVDKDPNYYPAQLLLANYYVGYVNHFKLAYSYYQQASKLFFKQAGSPPYQDAQTINDHAELLSIAHQVYLNLDDYSKALSFLNDFEQAGYQADWVSSSKAWVLMKLGRVKEAIQITEATLANSLNQGRALNMLGILYSVDNQPDLALKIFNQAVRWEQLLGDYGHPATPLNNSGEVFRERFKDQQAEFNWLKAKQMQDGCEHVLPSLNLAILYLDQLKGDSAQNSMDTFEGCVAQFTENNDEEHASLVNLVRSRIALRRGQIELALKLILRCLEQQQWFGKIGTNQEDLQLAAYVTYLDILQAQNNQLYYKLPDGWLDRVKHNLFLVKNRVLWRWYARKVRFLALKLNNFEDLKIRHTDSLLEYPKLGDILTTFPTSASLKRIKAEEREDSRSAAKIYYDLYRAELLITAGDTVATQQLLKQLTKRLRQLNRMELDAGVWLRVLILKAKLLSREEGYEYPKLVTEIFKLEPATIRNQGLSFPVKLVNSSPESTATPELKAKLAEAGFTTDLESPAVKFTLVYRYSQGRHILAFDSKVGVIPPTSIRNRDLSQGINALVEAIFVEKKGLVAGAVS